MLLKDYLNEYNIAYKDFAKLIETSPNYLYQLVNGHKNCSKKMARRLELVTGGRVTRMEALYPEDYIQETESGKQMRLSTCPRLD